MIIQSWVKFKLPGYCSAFSSTTFPLGLNVSLSLQKLYLAIEVIEKKTFILMSVSCWNSLWDYSTVAITSESFVPASQNRLTTVRFLSDFCWNTEVKEHKYWCVGWKFRALKFFQTAIALPVGWAGALACKTRKTSCIFSRCFFFLFILFFLSTPRLISPAR